MSGLLLIARHSRIASWRVLVPRARAVVSFLESCVVSGLMSIEPCDSCCVCTMCLLSVSHPVFVSSLAASCLVPLGGVFVSSWVLYHLGWCPLLV